MSKSFMVRAWRQTDMTNSHAYIYYMFDVALESLEWQRPQEDALQRLIRGRELDLLWSGEPDLHTEELGSCASCAPCGVKQVLYSFVTMAQSIWPTTEIARKVFSHLLSIYTVYWQTKFSLFDSSVFRRQESRMNFISCLKSVSMRIEVGTLPWLMTEDRDIPILRMAMVYTAHEEPLLRTQARNAMLTLLSKIKIGEGELLRTALEMAKSRKLGWVIGKSWHCTWHVMPLYWTRWLGKASCWRIYALSRLSHLSFWSICFLTGDGTLLPHTISYFTCWTIHDVIEHIQLHFRFSRLTTPLCTLLWQNWANMAQAAKNRNAPALQKWAFREEDCIPDTPQRSERWGAWDNDLLKSEEQGLCKSRLRCFVSPNLCVPKWCNQM